MPRTLQQKLGDYPEAFMEIAQRAYLQQDIAPIRVGQRNAAMALLHKFNRFRNILVDLRHEFALASKDLCAAKREVDGEWWLTFTYFGLYERRVFAQVRESVEVYDDTVRDVTPGAKIVDEITGMNRLGPAPTETADDYIARVYGLNKISPGAVDPDTGMTMPKSGEEAGKLNSSCEHEWNQYDNCVKCGEPK